MEKVFLDIYNLTSDTNFAPHHDGEIMSLACCMVYLRKHVGEIWFSMENPKKDLDYWVLGRVGHKLDTHKKNWLIYFMKVTDVLSFDRYHHEFQGRKDELYEFRNKCKCQNDNCSHRLNYCNYHQHTKVPDHDRRHDIGKGKYVLISNDYCYYDWGRRKNNILYMDEWKIPELYWKPEGKKGPFYRKYRFENPEIIIEKLQELKEHNYERYLPDRKKDDDYHQRKTEKW